MDVVHTQDQIWTWYALCESQLTIVHILKLKTNPAFLFIWTIHIEYIIYSIINVHTQKNKQSPFLLLHRYQTQIHIFPSKSTSTLFSDWTFDSAKLDPRDPQEIVDRGPLSSPNLLGYLPTRSTCSVSWRLCRGKSAKGQMFKQQISD